VGTANSISNIAEGNGTKADVKNLVQQGTMVAVALATDGTSAAGTATRATTAEGEALIAANPVGSALKSDATHNAATFMRSDAAAQGTHFPIVGGDGVGRTLTQIPGELNGVKGRYEYIVEPSGNLTHQRFVANGTINGIPNKP
jgi:hypothetical protein